MLAVTKSPFSVQMIASLSGDVKPCLPYPYTIVINWKGTEKNP